MAETHRPFYMVGLGLTHVEVLAALHAESFDEGWSAPSFDTTLRMPGAYGFVAVNRTDDEPLGFVLFRAALFGDSVSGGGGGEAEVLTIATRPQARHQGVAHVLMAQGLDLAAELGVQTMFLEVAADNAAALSLYRSLGFEQTGRRKAYYARPDGLRVDALVMACEVSP